MLSAARKMGALCLLCLSWPLLASETHIEIHGSNTIGADLAPALVAGFLQKRSGQDAERQPGAQDNVLLIQAGQDDNALTARVAAHGSSTGFQALLDGTADIWAASRPAKPAEIDALAAEADLTALASEHIIAIDGLAILIHPDNPLTSLTLDQLGQIFAGDINNWAQLGGADLPIQRYARDSQSGTWDTFRNLVLGDRYQLAASTRRYESNDQLSDDVSQNPAAIGFAGLASIRDSKVVAVADGDAPALKPDRLTVASEDYPLTRRLFLYTREDNNSNLVNEFIAFVLSEQGQQIVDDNGGISQTPMAMDPEFDDNTPASFKSLTQNYRRLTVNFRFSEGHTRLDNKAQRDLTRVIDYLERENRQGSDLLLIGFADQQTSELRAQMISELRALSVVRALREKGTEVDAYTGYGHFMPVGRSGGRAGQQRNGRVEVWVKH